MWAALGVGLLYLMHGRSSGPDEGATAAPFELPLANRDGTFRLADQRGKPVVIEVFASWCGACRRATPSLAEAYRAHGRQATFIGVSVDDRREDAARGEKRLGHPLRRRPRRRQRRPRVQGVAPADRHRDRRRRRRSSRDDGRRRRRATSGAGSASSSRHECRAIRSAQKQTGRLWGRPVFPWDLSNYVIRSNYD